MLQTISLFQFLPTRINLLFHAHISKEPTPDIPQLSINVEGIFNLLTKIEPNKAAGPDGIPPIDY